MTGWGLVGTRGLAAYGCAPAFKEADNAELVAVLSRDPEKAKAFADEHGAAWSGSEIDEFLAAPGVEAVWIASPTYLHYEQASKALAAGKHVLVEKPLAATKDEARQLVEAARSAGLILATGYQARYISGHLEMRRLLEEGALGDVSVARTFYAIHRPGPPPEWRQRRETARWGALADIGTHHVDLLRMLLGEIKDAHAMAGHQLGYETDDVVVGSLSFESGAFASLALSANVWRPGTLVEVHGTEGSLVAENTSPRGEGEVTWLRPDKEPVSLMGPHKLSWTAQLETLSDAVAGKEVSYATGEDGARNIEVLEQLIP